MEILRNVYAINNIEGAKLDFRVSSSEIMVYNRKLIIDLTKGTFFVRKDKNA